MWSRLNVGNVLAFVLARLLDLVYPHTINLVVAMRRKRGRPRVLTPEQKRENAKRRQRLHRQKADREWLRATNSGRIIYLDVLHWLDLIEFLVALRVLDPSGVESPPAIEDAVEEALGLAE